MLLFLLAFGFEIPESERSMSKVGLLSEDKMSVRVSILKIALSLGAVTLGPGLVQATSLSPNLGGSTTIGNFNAGNCYPFMCNDSGTNIGQSIDYQQVFGGAGFGGAVTINAITWNFDATTGGNPIALGGTYMFEWGYAASNSVNNLSTTLANNYISGPTVLETATIPAGGINDNPTLTLSGFSPFVYNPIFGNLLLEIIVTGQDKVANGSGNGYNQADSTGSVTSRAYCLTNVGCFANATGLVTTFATTPIPEPGTLVLLGGGLLAFGMIRMRRSKA
jgi:hypothetical protein